MGLGNGYQVQPDLVTRAECIKVSRGVGIPERTVTLSPRLMPDTFVGIILQQRYKSKYDKYEHHKNTAKHLR